MISVKIISVGDFKETYLRNACDEYKKRLSSWCKIEETVIKEERLPENYRQADINNALKEEEKRISEKINNKSYVIAMCIEGKQFSSEEFADEINNVINNGNSEITFIIGSSFGLSEGIKSRANLKMSVSKMTFPHQLFKVILYETVYRSLSIINGTKYHK